MNSLKNGPRKEEPNPLDPTIEDSVVLSDGQDLRRLWLTVYILITIAVFAVSEVTFLFWLAYPTLPGLLGQGLGFVSLAAFSYFIARYARRRLFNFWRQKENRFRLRLEEMNNAATHDDLTHLYNRHYFFKSLERELAVARRRRLPLAILMIDMDDLKLINDEYGHRAGDAVLTHLAQVLQRVARSHDVVARVGGDEFAIIMPGADHRGAEAVATQLWRELDRNSVSLAENSAVIIGISIGVAGYPWSGDTAQEIMYWGDAALYTNKLARKGFNGEEAAQEGARVSDAVVKSLSSVLQIRNRLTHRHSSRVAQLAAAVARQLGLSANETLIIQHAATLHDIGKMGVPDSILGKPSALTSEELAIVRRHSELGYRILKDIDVLSDIAMIVYAHHERYDGTGYPKGLVGEEIPLGARVFAVVDAYDAMTNQRPYRKAIPQEEAIGEIALRAGSQFDPRVVAAFLKVVGADVNAPADNGHRISSNGHRRSANGHRRDAIVDFN